METFVRVALLLAFLCSPITCRKLKARNVERVPVKLNRAQLMNIEAQVIKQAIIDENSPEPSAVECGKPNSKLIANETSVITEADQNEFPWEVILLVHVEKSFFYCGGSLINNYWVLTSAHCVDEAASIYIYVGTHSISATSEPHRQIHVTDLYYVHPDWNHEDFAGDIALVQLVFPVAFTEYIKPICLPENSDNDRPGDLVILTGWGRSEDGHNLNSALRKSNSVVISNEKCSKLYSIVTTEMLCTNGSAGATCNADSGGPLHFVDSDGIYTQIGVVSFGSDQGCKKGHPTGFTRIESYLEWIDFVLNAMQESNATDVYEENESYVTHKPSRLQDHPDVPDNEHSEESSDEDKSDQDDLGEQPMNTKAFEEHQISMTERVTDPHGNHDGIVTSKTNFIVNENEHDNGHTVNSKDTYVQSTEKAFEYHNVLPVTKVIPKQHAHTNVKLTTVRSGSSDSPRSSSDAVVSHISMFPTISIMLCFSIIFCVFK